MTLTSSRRLIIAPFDSAEDGSKGAVKEHKGTRKGGVGKAEVRKGTVLCRARGSRIANAAIGGGFGPVTGGGHRPAHGDLTNLQTSKLLRFCTLEVSPVRKSLHSLL